MLCKANMFQLAAALFALLLGLLFYLLSRPADSIYLFTVFSYAPSQSFDFSGLIGQWIPSFIHTYAFILLTVIAIGNSPRVILVSSIFWVVVGWLFELGQHPSNSILIVEYIPEWFSGILILENTASYFLHGSFDTLDLLATVAGALAAWATYQITRQKECSHETG